MRESILIAFTGFASLCAGTAKAQETASLDRAMESFWAANSTKDQDKAAAAIAASGASFEAIYAKLAEGRVYRPTTNVGEQHWTTLSGGSPSHATTIVIPKDYNPSVRYPVRFFLHGGVARPDPDQTESEGPAGPQRSNRPRRRMEFKERYIAVYPSGHSEAEWWFSNQMANFDEILDRLKRGYNIDENRVHLMGVSDGGTGSYFVALKNPTPWSVFFPLNGFLKVLANPLTRADGDLFASNLKNRPLYIVNGERDPLYPVIAVLPYMVLLKRVGVDLKFRPMEGAGHDTSWWPNESAAIDSFEEEHPRDPFPVRVSWETERMDRYNRMAWIAIDKLDAARTETKFSDDNTIEIEEPLDFGLRVDSRRGDSRKVIDVIDGTNAAAMGLKKGDTVIRMDAVIIRTAGDMGRAFDDHTAGEEMEFEVERKGARLTLHAVFPPTPKPAKKEEAFHHPHPSGRVEGRRIGNDYEIGTRGVGSFTLLLSPSVVDFDKPVVVRVNGRRVFESKVEKSVPTLLKYAARDNDRSMLFAAELRIEVP